VPAPRPSAKESAGLHYARAINRIRGRYLELAGDDARYFMLGGNDDVRGALANMGIVKPSRLQLFFTLASMLLTINSVLFGTTAALALARAAHTSLFATVVVGVFVAGAAGAAQQRWQRRRHVTAREGIEPLFPSP